MSDGIDMGMRRPRWDFAEVVTPGHPDKVCDQISDAILDAALTQDKFSRVAIETHGGHGLIEVRGEMTTKANLRIVEIARDVYATIGHTNLIAVTDGIVPQSPNIRDTVNEDRTTGKELGAGDQGIMVGYATNETPERMPLAWMLSKQLCDRMVQLRKDNTLPWLKPDGKSQVVIKHEEVEHVTIAAHYQEGMDLDNVRDGLYKHVLKYVFPDTHLEDHQIVINGGGEFHLGGFDADAGTTGRKIVVDQFGPGVAVGGGAFSGKDPTKVDRTAAYFSRFVAKSIVDSGLASKARVRVVYAIGQPRPFAVEVTTDNGDEEGDALLEKKVMEMFDFSVAGMIERLELRNPQGWRYQQTAELGHYGTPSFPWEKSAQI
jgi:S-adenosylmethionine synthetase